MWAKSVEIKDHPHMEEVEIYWKLLWGAKLQHKT